MNSVAELLLRVVLGLFFLFAGIGHALNFDSTIDGAQILLGGDNPDFFKGAAYAAVFTLIAGGLSFVLGYKTRLGAMLLICFLIPATMVHMRVMEMSMNTASILDVSSADKAKQLILTLRDIGVQGHQGNVVKNFILMVNCVFFLLSGSAKFSLDQRRRKR